MRTRSRSKKHSTSSTLRWRQGSRVSWSDWMWLGGVESASYTHDDLESITDRKTPGYFKAVREGTVIPVSPMSKRTETVVLSPSGLQAVHAYDWNNNIRFEYELRGAAKSNPEWCAAPAAPNLNGNVVLQEALSRAQSDAFDALTFAAEFRKTVEGVVTLRSRAMAIFERFESRVRSSEKKKRFRAHEASQILAEIWLEMRYMWRPLIYDMQAAEEAIRRLAAGVEDPLQRAYASDGDASQNSSTFASNTIQVAGAGGSIAGLRYIAVQTAVVERTVHAAVGVKAITREISMIDPVVTAWELVPFSFVLDWFVTIGDALTAFSPFATGQLQYATLATRTTTTYRTSIRFVPSSGFVRLSGNAGEMTHTKTVVEYSRNPALPTPTLAFNIDLNLAKIIDLVALWSVINKKTLMRLLRHF